MRSLGDHHSNDHGTGPGSRRLTLRTAQGDDWARIEALAANPEIGLLARNADQARDSDATLFGVALRETGQLIGQAGFQRLADVPAPVELMVWLNPAYWGKGLGTEAVHELIDRAFGDGRIAVLWSAIGTTNTRARRVLEKSGFEFRRGGVPQPAAGSEAPTQRFVLDRRNWASLKAWGAEAPAH